MESSLDKIKGILKKEIGLDASTIGEATINKILNERMRSCHLSEVDEYYMHLHNNPEELHLLLEISVIPETWFFRDDKPFKIILDKVSKRLISQPKSPCRILCIPCSTGEEPYSIAMYLDDNGMPKPAYDIQAIDISHKSIAFAKQAVYCKNSFRGKQVGPYINKYFTADNTEYSLHNNIKSAVAFNELNILQTQNLPINNKFDIILCRNLLIYFDATTKATAYKNLNSILKDDGVLFIGHSEFGSVADDIFKVTKLDSVFCLVKKTATSVEESIKTTPFIQNNKSSPNLTIVKTPETKAFSSPDKYAVKNNTAGIINSQDDSKKSTTDLLDQARTLANSGNLTDAETLCLKHIDEYGDSEESFFLLGLISEASGDDLQAHNFYKKALYLNPKHYETLIHLSLIVQSQGDIEAGLRLKERAERAVKE